mmetsp:Transcript_5072/g.15315  ORF Transcript_5072/g.15315 Transcript_5072/m.15315 type:complete len:264 (+) Transcript_5072:102-893(+)
MASILAPHASAGKTATATVMHKWSTQRARMDWCHSARNQPDDESRYDYASLAKALRPDGVRVKHEKLRRQLTREGRLEHGRVKPSREGEKIVRVARTTEDDDTEIETPAADVAWLEAHAPPARRWSAPPKTTEAMTDAELAKYGKDLLKRQQRRHPRKRRAGSAPPISSPPQPAAQKSLHKSDEPLLPPKPEQAKPEQAKPEQAPPAWRANGRGKTRAAAASKKTVRYSSVDAARKDNKNDESFGSFLITSAVKSAHAVFYGA